MSKIQIVLSTWWEVSQSTFHFLETISISSTKLIWLFNCVSFGSIHFACHIVYEIFYSNYFAHFGTRIILLPALWIILSHSFCVVESLHCNFQNVENSNCTYHIAENIKRCFPHCGHYQRFSTKSSEFLTVAICIVNNLEHFYIYKAVFWTDSGFRLSRFVLNV